MRSGYLPLSLSSVKPPKEILPLCVPDTDIALDSQNHLVPEIVWKCSKVFKSSLEITLPKM